MNDLRDRILTAIREADTHSCMYGEGTDAGDLADAVMSVLATEQAAARGIPLICSDERHQVKVSALEIELARALATIARAAEATRRTATDLTGPEEESGYRCAMSDVRGALIDPDLGFITLYEPAKGVTS